MNREPRRYRTYEVRSRAIPPGTRAEAERIYNEERLAKALTGEGTVQA
jgi:hypothetical protein